MRHFKHLALMVTVTIALSTLFLMAVFGGSTTIAAGNTHYVAPGGACGGASPCYATIQAALNAAQPGDTIKVAQGTYNDLHTIPGLSGQGFTATQIIAVVKTITLQGGYAPPDWSHPDPTTHPTILDARDGGRGAIITGTIAPTLAGFEIKNGDATDLGGEYWGGVGGGVYIKGARAILRGNSIHDNRAYYGAGMFLQESPSLVANNRMYANTADARGGGMYLDDSDAVLRENVFLNNSAVKQGGGISAYWSAASLISNRFVDNTSDSYGGGLHLYGSGGEVEGNLFRNNSASYAGGGIYLNYQWGDIPHFVNNAIIANQADQGSGLWFGGGQYSRSHIVGMVHNTLSGNSDGPGVMVEQYASLALTNTIIAGHSVGITTTTGSTVTMHATFWHDNATDFMAEGVFQHTNDYQGDPKFDSDGFHLTAGSAAINKGIDAGVRRDIDGEIRPWDGGFDLGADEYDAAIPKSTYLPLALKQ